MPTDYLATVSRVHYDWWSHTFFRSDAFFPGVAALTLALVAVACGRAWRDARARMLLAVTVVGFALSLGPAFPLYEPLYPHRAAAAGHPRRSTLRVLAIVGVAGLAGFGVAWLAERWASVSGPAAGTRVGIGLAAIVVVVNVEAFAAPLYFVRDPGIPPVHRVLAGETGAVVADLPLPEPGAIARNARAVVASTVHWKPLVNGYSGFVPRSYVEHSQALAGFPDPTAFEALRRIGVTHLVVRADEIPGVEGALSRRRDIDLLAADGPLRVYRLRGAPLDERDVR